MIARWLFHLAVVAVCLLPAACSIPDDESFFRISAFREDGQTSSISVLHSDLQDGQSDLVDAVVSNLTIIVGSESAGGSAIHIYHAGVRYEWAGYSLPTFEYPVTLTVPARSDDEDGMETLEGLPLVPLALKGWLLNSSNVPAATTASTFHVTARVTLRARSDEGTELTTSGSLGIIFNGNPTAAAATTSTTTTTTIDP